jgi:hypothetical protein
MLDLCDPVKNKLSDALYVEKASFQAIQHFPFHVISFR